MTNLMKKNVKLVIRKIMFELKNRIYFARNCLNYIIYIYLPPVTIDKYTNALLDINAHIYTGRWYINNAHPKTISVLFNIQTMIRSPKHTN